MRKANSRRLWLVASGVVACLATGCLPFGDPEGPGAAGTLSVDPSVDVTPFKTLAVRVFPDPGPAFDATAVLPADAFPADEALAGVRFPHPYQVGTPLGTTPAREWRLVAWLSRLTGAIDRVEPGDVFCTARFRVDSCGSFGDYCGVTRGVDCTLVSRR
jgi:hypothetical protein